jgi:hypothetical protein
MRSRIDNAEAREHYYRGKGTLLGANEMKIRAPPAAAALHIRTWSLRIHLQITTGQQFQQCKFATSFLLTSVRNYSLHIQARVNDQRLQLLRTFASPSRTRK